MNKKEMEKIKTEEYKKKGDFGIKTQWFRHRETGDYQFQINNFELEDYEKIKDKSEYTAKKDLCIYEKNRNSIITRLTDCLKCIYSGKQYNKDDKRLMSLNEAVKFIDIVDEKKYIKNWKTMEQKEWNYYLNVLPPIRWKTIKNVEIFALSEMMTGIITQHFICYKNKYYSAFRKTTTKIENIVSEFLKQMESDKQ